MNAEKGLAKEFEKVMAEVKRKPIHEAILRLGYFMTNNPHEEGNTEFVFGEYPEEVLGKTAYEDLFGPVTALDELIAKLTIAVNLVLSIE